MDGRSSQKNLVSILWRLSCVFDCIMFGSVCTWWRSVLLENHHSLTYTSLSIVPAKNHDNKYEMICLSDSKAHQISLQLEQNKIIFSSSSCWVLTVDYSSGYAIHLVNPLTGVEVPLPPLTTISGFHSTGWKLNFGYFVHKVVLSSNHTSVHNCIAVARYGYGNHLSFCKVGDKKWAIFSGQYNAFDDVTYYQGQFYAVTWHGEVVLCDVGPERKVVSVYPSTHKAYLGKKYLVDSSGDLLKVTRPRNLRVNDAHMNCEFLVEKLDLIKKEWKKVETLGDQVLFLGYNCTTSLPAQSLYAYKENCVYFYKDEGLESVGVFDLRDESIHLFHGSARPMLFVTPSSFEVSDFLQFKIV